MSKTSDWDDLKRRSEAGRIRLERMALGQVDDPLCTHVVERKAVEQMRPTGGAVRCAKCGAWLPISTTRRELPDGSIL